VYPIAHDVHKILVEIAVHTGSTHHHLTGSTACSILRGW
jgi:hypothetical protein